MNVIPIKSAAEVQDPVDQYHDADGFVFTGTEAEAAANGWTRLTDEQKAAIQPMNRFDKRQYEAIEARKGKP